MIPQPFDMTDPKDIKRWFNEMENYLKTSDFLHQGTDYEGRKYALEGFRDLKESVSNILELKEIRVSIKDGEALGKIHFENVKKYLIKTGWEKLHDAPFGSQWRHPNAVECGYRSTVISLPEDMEFADYKRRMSEILDIIEFAEDKSQLEIYLNLIRGDA